MKRSALASILFAASIGSGYSATILADRVVITNLAPPVAPATTAAFHLAEVQVFEQGTGNNVAAAALGGVATASSTGWGTQPAWAIDGNTDGAFGANTSWHDRDGDANGTGVEDPDVFTVNFSGTKTVDSFQFWGRADCCPERDDNFMVQFYNGPALTGTNSPVSIGASFNSGIVPITIPEPASPVLLAAIGLAGILRRRRH